LKDGEYAMVSGTALTSFREFYQKGNLFSVSKKSLGLLKDQENKIMLFGESYVRYLEPSLSLLEFEKTWTYVNYF
jgi:hypothetical protein